MLKFSAVADDLKGATADDVVVLPLFAGALDDARSIVGRSIGEAIVHALTGANFTGEKVGDTCMLRGIAVGASAGVLVVGLGKVPEGKKRLEAVQLRTAGAAVAAALEKTKQTTLRLALKGVRGRALTAAQSVAFAGGIIQRAYRFDVFRTLKEDEKPTLQQVIAHHLQGEALNAEFALREQPLLHGLTTMRDLGNTPANVLFPVAYAERVEKLKAAGVKITVLDEKAIADAKMGALLGVAQGSVRAPRVVVLEYKDKGHTQAPVALVGKGVCFDSGGISIKPATDMENMIYDMSGSAAVVGAVEALARAKAPVHVVGIIGLVENMPDANAQRPGDIVTAASGTTIEVLNTDAEGRLVLCDLLHYVQKHHQPRMVVDIATLTGAIVVALGTEYAGLFANDDTLAEALLASGRETGDKVWRLPLGEAYNKQLKSRFADVANISTTGRGGGSITAACFLQRFINEGVDWAHVDIAGTAYGKTAEDVRSAGSSGFGVRLLEDFVRRVS